MKIPLSILLSAICMLAADQAKFETASVKKADQCTFNTSLDPGLITLKGIPLQPVLVQAFRTKVDRLEGAPSWTESATDCFDIIAKMPEGATLAQLPELLQALLAERFKLTWHKENRQKQGYALTVDKGGAKLEEDDPAVDFMGGHGTMMIGRAGVGAYKQATTMAGLASILTIRLGDPVEDQTGLKGRYDIELHWRPDATLEHGRGGGAPLDAASDPAADPLPDLPTALRETLGLKLEKHAVAVEFVVIDHIERVPTGN